jgi:Flp pilus assembly protein TadG
MSLEMVILTPVFVLFMLLLVGVGRIVDAQSQVDGAARDGARAASIARDPGTAGALAEPAVDANLKGKCNGPVVVQTDTSQWRQPGGQVKVTVSCDLDLTSLSLLKVPGSKTLTGSAVAPIDTFTNKGVEDDGDGQ